MAGKIRQLLDRHLDRVRANFWCHVTRGALTGSGHQVITGSDFLAVLVTVLGFQPADRSMAGIWKSLPPEYDTHVIALVHGKVLTVIGGDDGAIRQLHAGRIPPVRTSAARI